MRAKASQTWQLQPLRRDASIPASGCASGSQGGYSASTVAPKEAVSLTGLLSSALVKVQGESLCID